MDNLELAAGSFLGDGVIRLMKLNEIILKALDGQISWIQAAQIAGVTDRHMRRLKIRFEANGIECLRDRRRGKKPHNAVNSKAIENILELYRSQYFDFSVRHFHEAVTTKHGITQSYSFVKNVLQATGLVVKDPRRSKHRKKRPRKPLVGMMLHLDGSTHPWLSSQPDFYFDLMVIMDDANNEIYDGYFALQESTDSSLEVIKNTLMSHGIFCSLYTDRGSHFKTANKKNIASDKKHTTHIEDVFEKLGIRLIAANSPQARGRGERMWRTIQGRLPQELRLHNIENIDQANIYLRTIFIPQLNKLFKKEPEQNESAFVPLPDHFNLERVCAREFERAVKPDNTLEFKTRVLQIHETPLRTSFAKCRVKLLEHLNGKIEIFYGPHLIAEYESLPINTDIPTDLKEIPKKPNKRAA